MEHFFTKLLEVFKTPLGWISAIGAYFLPLKGVYELILAIVIFDFVTGLWASASRLMFNFPQCGQEGRQ